MDSVITIAGVDFDADDRADARFNALDQLTLSVDGYDTLAFTLSGVGPMPAFRAGDSVVFKVDGVVKFRGDLVGPGHRQSGLGWSHAYTATGLKRRADRVSVTGSDGSGVAAFNLSPGDDYYVPSNAGQTVGDIVRRVLTVPATASALDALGIGAYTSLSPPTLPADTLADLALLDVVPPTAVALAGLGVLNHLESLIDQRHPKFVTIIRPDGTIRFLDLFDLPTFPLVIPGEGTGITPSPVGWPSVTRDADGCFTAIEVRGRNVQPTFLSVADGTLAEDFDPDDPDGLGGDPWTIDDFLNPRDSVDMGALSSVTPSTATVDPDDATHFWSSGFWPGRDGWIFLQYLAGTGIEMYETRKITSSAALTAGGSATISWDSGDPITTLDYDRYRIVGTATPRAEVGRLYTIRDPSTGDLGLDTWVGSHLVPRFPRPVAWRSHGVGYQTTTPVGTVCWSATGAEPWNEVPAGFEILPETGQIRFVRPVVMETTSTDVLRRGYPTTFAGGLPADVKVMLAYDRGDAVVRVPSSGFEGTAYDEDEIERVWVLHMDSWTYGGDTANMIKMAQAHLDAVKDTVIEGSILHHGYPAPYDEDDNPDGFDPLELGYALSLSIAGATSPWDDTPLPVRSVTLSWPQGSGDQHQLVFQFSSRKRPFQGDDLYVHPLDGGGVGAFGGQMPFGQASFMDTGGLGVFDPGTGMADGSAPGMDGPEFALDPAAFRQAPAPAGKSQFPPRMRNETIDPPRAGPKGEAAATGGLGGLGAALGDSLDDAKMSTLPTTTGAERFLNNQQDAMAKRPEAPKGQTDYAREAAQDGWRTGANPEPPPMPTPRPLTDEETERRRIEQWGA